MALQATTRCRPDATLQASTSSGSSSAPRARPTRPRSRPTPKNRSTDLESRAGRLAARVESDLETIRQAHYAAGDQVNQAQGQLYEASAEVGRLEAEIRFVVEGRQRVEQRLAQLKEQTAQWAARRDDAVLRNRELWPNRAVDAEEKADDPGRPGPKSIRRGSCRRSGRRAAPGPGQGHRAARRRRPRCSSKSRCWPPISATSKNNRAAAHAAAREAGRRPQCSGNAPDEARLTNLQGAAI